MRHFKNNIHTKRKYISAIETEQKKVVSFLKQDVLAGNNTPTFPT
jgi:hypothetical protein